MNKTKKVTFQHIITIEGKNGLFRIINPGKSTLIIETIDDKRKKMIIDGRQHVSLLDKISIYNNGTENKKDLIDVLKTINKHYNKKIVADVDINNVTELTAFMNKVLPTYDKEKVYPSNIKKIVKWYNILISFYPELITLEEKPAKKPTKKTIKKGSQESTKKEVQTNKKGKSLASKSKDHIDKTSAKKPQTKAKNSKDSTEKKGKTTTIKKGNKN